MQGDAIGRTSEMEEGQSRGSRGHERGLSASDVAIVARNGAVERALRAAGAKLDAESTRLEDTCRAEWPFAGRGGGRTQSKVVARPNHAGRAAVRHWRGYDTRAAVSACLLALVQLRYRYRYGEAAARRGTRRRRQRAVSSRVLAGGKIDVRWAVFMHASTPSVSIQGGRMPQQSWK